MRSPSLLRPLALATTLSLALAAPASAQIVAGQQIGVDLNSTATWLGGTGNGTTTNWTGVNSFTTGISALDLSTGNTISGVTIGFASNGGGGFNTLGDLAGGNSITTAPVAITSDGAYGTSSGANTLTLSFSGLNTSLTYTLEIFSVYANGTNADTPSINGVNTSWASGFSTRGTRWSQTTGATFTGLSTDGFGTLSFGITDSLGSNAIMNGAILTASAIPEPSTYAAIFGVSALALAAYRRRTRNSNECRSIKNS